MIDPDDESDTAIPREITTVPSSSEYDCSFITRPNGENEGSCDDCDVEFSTSEEYREHCRNEHPLQCSNWGCNNIAAYSTLEGPHSFCAEHADQYLSANYNTTRVGRPANSEAERLANDHPIEEVLNGLGA